ncbi:MAG TPA: transcription antitermination factor NusB [Acidobacteriota bacterium]|nr:transcription antitermination factor NusB [Acidobacteriota bacterium]
MSDSTPDPRIAAVRLLQRLSAPGSHLGSLSRQPEFQALADRDRRFLMQLAYGVERERGKLDFYISRLSKRPLHKLDAPVLWILRLALFQILNLRVPQRAAVHEAVESCRRLGVTSAGGFVNALLRRFLRQQPPLPQGRRAEDLAVRTSHPLWLVRRYLKRFGWRRAERLLHVNNSPPESCFWVNTRRQSLREMGRLLEEAGIGYSPWPDLPEALKVDASLAAHRLAEEGRGFFMDAGSQQVLHGLDLEETRLVADVCAAPGSKAFLLAARMPSEARLYACDRSFRRLGQAQRRQRSLRLPGLAFIQADWRRGSVLAPRCDFILADVPCSGLGTLRSNPDIRWKFQEADLARLQRLQSDILANAYGSLRPGGRLLYVTCSSEEEENEQVVEAFLDSDPQARLLQPFEFSLHSRRPGDAFFSALLGKPGQDY